MNRLLDGFYRPLVELRNKGRGYAVSLVKAGVRLRGLDVGEVRPPLSPSRRPRTSRNSPSSSSGPGTTAAAPATDSIESRREPGAA